MYVTRDFTTATLLGIIAPEDEVQVILRLRLDDGTVVGIPAAREATFTALSRMFPIGGYADRRLRVRTDGHGMLDAMMYADEEEG